MCSPLVMINGNQEEAEEDTVLTAQKSGELKIVLFLGSLSLLECPVMRYVN
jgi:hypothetical protein